MMSLKAARRSELRREMGRSRIRPERMSRASSYIMLPTWYMWMDSPWEVAKFSTSLRYDFLSIPTWPVTIARMVILQC